MRPCRARLPLACALAAALAAPVRAQNPLGSALDLEQQGRMAEAAAAYRALLAERPADLGALLGAERAYDALGRRDSAVALARRALAVDSSNRVIHVILLRSLQAVHDDSAVVAAFTRWTAVAPGDAAPYEEMARLLLAQGRDAEARAVVERGRRRLGDARAAAAQMAEVEMREAAYGAAAEEWRGAVARTPALVDGAAHSLRTVLPMDREMVLRTLTSGPEAAAGRAIAVALLLSWEEPRRAWSMLRSGLADADPTRAAQLAGFAEGAERLGGAEAHRVAAEALELLAQGQRGSAAAGTRIESARAYAAAGDVDAARRLLRVIADAAGTPAEVASAARATLIELAAAQGTPEEAARLLDRERGTLTEGESQRLARSVGFAWLRAGALDRAAAAVAGDASLAAEEVRGWVALYRGDLRVGAAALRSVGADAGDPERAPDRAAAVALVATVGRDSLPALGAALLDAVRGDTLGAARALRAVAATLDGDARDEVGLLAARYALAAHDTAAAVAAWRDVASRPGPSTAGAAALLALARVSAERGRFAEAAERLEALILRHPASALVPEARRELDRVRGLVPRT